MELISRYIDANWQPLSGLFIGVALMSIYFSLYLTRHRVIIPLLAKNVFGNNFMSERSAEGLFNVLSSYIFAIGGIWIIAALFYLAN